MSTRARKKTEAATDSTGDAANTGMDVFDQQIEARNAERQQQAAAITHQVAESTRMEREDHAAAHAPSGNGHAATVEKKKWTPPADPFGFENVKGGENRVRLLKSEGEGAWVIRFEHNPNLDKGPEGETYTKENPHPVLKMLKDEGFRWGFDGGDSKGGWGKRFEGDAYGQDHIEARRVLQKAAEMVGHTMDQGRIPD